ncbi:MAG: transcription termination/antitermination protein NusA [Caldilineales bacterium]|nr:transcription termination/antitermination protein NusA [Caldilineales bacterium]
MNKQLLMAINQICAERNLKPQVVIAAVEQALVSAYRRNFGSSGDVQARLDPETGDMRIYERYVVVTPDEIEDPKTQISPTDAAAIDPRHATVGDEVLIERTPNDFGRIAAQAAKQVILQRIREAERDAVYEDYVDREGELVQGTVRSIEHGTGNLVIALDGGRAEAVMHRPDQIPGERLRVNASVLAYMSEIVRGPRGPMIHLSRTHRNMLRRLLEKEVPEIKQGSVEIKAIAREPGSRSKVAVTATQSGVDPVGSCVGMRGVRIQNIVNELNGEKIDVIEWDADGERFVANALSPARVTDVLLFPELDRTAMVIVPDNQLSLAIGKEGQNARLVAKLTGWRIDIKSETEAVAEGMDELERQHVRMERRTREHAEDLLDAARRILEEETLPDLAAITPEIEEAAAADAFADALAQVTAPEVIPDLDSAILPEKPIPAMPEVDEIKAAEEAEARALAQKLSRAMAGVTDDEDTGFDADAFSRIFGGGAAEGGDEEEGEAADKKKKSRRKDRQMVYDEEAKRVVAVKRRKPTRGGRQFDAEDFESDL